MEGLKKDLTCEVCSSQYRLPKILPCLHIYCKSCLEGLVTTSKHQETKYLTCPQCKETHEVPLQGVGGFKTYQVVSNLLELLHIHEMTCGVVAKKIQCESGLDENLAFARCLSCAEYLCISCFHIHQKLMVTKHHNILTLDKIRQSDKTVLIESLKKRLHFCDEHEEEILKLYCKSCKEVICRDCALVKHRVHDYVFIREICPDMQSSLEALLKETRKKKEEFRDHKWYIETVHTANEEALKSCLKEVNETCDKVIEAIETRRAFLIANLHSVHEAENEQHEERKKKLDHSIAQFSDSIRFTHNLLNRDDDVEIMTMGLQAMATLTRVKRVTFDKEASKPTLLRFKFSSPMKPIITGFGNVVSGIQSSEIFIEDIATHEQIDKVITFTVRLSDDINHCDATPWLSVKVVYNDEAIPTKIINSCMNHWRVTLSEQPYKSGLHTIEVKFGENVSVNHAFTVRELSFYELRKKLQTTYHPQ